MKRPGRMLLEVFRSFFKKVATTKYPYVKAEVAPNFRGKLRFYRERCIGCKLCMKDCPSNAITVHKVGEKQFEVELDLGKCLFCVQCVDSCPRKALEASPEFELAGIERSTLKVMLDAGPEKPVEVLKTAEPSKDAEGAHAVQSETTPPAAAEDEPRKRP